MGFDRAESSIFFREKKLTGLDTVPIF